MLSSSLERILNRPQFELPIFWKWSSLISVLLTKYLALQCEKAVGKLALGVIE